MYIYTPYKKYTAIALLRITTLLEEPLVPFRTSGCSLASSPPLPSATWHHNGCKVKNSCQGSGGLYRCCSSSLSGVLYPSGAGSDTAEVCLALVVAVTPRSLLLFAWIWRLIHPGFCIANRPVVCMDRLLIRPASYSRSPCCLCGPGCSYSSSVSSITLPLLPDLQ